ncbi:hypothetical protein FOL47_001204, partial [Perkinsus chesapeaki]
IKETLKGDFTSYARLIGGAELEPGTSRAVVNESTDQNEADGISILKKVLVNKRKRVREASVTQCATIASVLEELYSQGFIDATDDALIGHVGQELHNCSVLTRHQRLPGSGLYVLGYGAVSVGRGPKARDIPVVAVCNRTALVNVYNVTDPYRCPLLPNNNRDRWGYCLALDGHCRTARGCTTLITAGCTTITLQPNKRYGWSFCPFVTSFSVGESADTTSLALGQISRLARLFHGASFLRPARGISDSALGLVKAVRDTWEGTNIEHNRCCWHAVEASKKLASVVQNSKEDFRRFVSRYLPRLYECSGPKIYDGYVRLVLDELERLHGKPIRDSLELSWVTHAKDMGSFHCACPLALALDIIRCELLGRGAQPVVLWGGGPSFDNICESYYSRLAAFTAKSSETTKSRSAQLGGQDGLIGRVRSFLQSHGEMSRSASVDYDSKGCLRLPLEGMFRKARERVAKTNDDIIFEEVSLDVLGPELSSIPLRIACIPSSRRGPLQPGEATARVLASLNGVRNSEEALSLEAYESKLLQIHLVVGVSLPGRTLLCSCRGFGSLGQCHHILIASMYKMGPAFAPGPATGAAASRTSNGQSHISSPVSGMQVGGSSSNSNSSSRPYGQPCTFTSSSSRSNSGGICIDGLSSDVATERTLRAIDTMCTEFPYVAWAGRPTRNNNPLQRHDTDVRAQRMWDGESNVLPAQRTTG